MKKILKRIVGLFFPITNFLSKVSHWRFVYCERNSKIVNSSFEGKNIIGQQTIIRQSFVGKNSYIGPNSVVNKTKIGRYCSIADNLYTGFGTHAITECISSFPAFYSNTESYLHYSYFKEEEPLIELYKRASKDKPYCVIIGNDVWIGSHVIILDGITIGDGAIVAAGAVVTHSVEPYTIVAGVPAKPIKTRFTNKQIQILMQIKWWNNNEQWIKNNFLIFNNIDDFFANNK